ncbi:hypothetical protein [Flavobacterium sp. KACC 22763]|uniref:hypothetical protein n=1 Tax=Flavobacterium sp. KACC 22763 TaxID=3025668 RepID=UPI00236570AD|nr:hypothetical protein [Flavobacterium sp. KACC 22763]WDF65655.1 hypothetical protein PQ463_05680 [Flavobacterium sp. KACC 22763]
MRSFLGQKNLSRGLRNNNPGNLIITPSAWQGKIEKSKNTDGHFEQFKELKYGIRAMLKDIINDISKGKNTIRLLISEYAPVIENNTALYIDFISKKTGIGKDEKIQNVDSLFLISIARAIMEYENGKEYADLIYDSDIDDAIDILGDINLKGVTVTTKRRFKFNYLIIPVLLFFYTVLTVIVTV